MWRENKIKQPVPVPTLPTLERDKNKVPGKILTKSEVGGPLMENINFLLDYFLSLSFPTLEEVNHLSKTQLDIVFISLRPLQVAPQLDLAEGNQKRN